MDTDNSGKVTYASWLPQKRLSPLPASGISRQNFNPGFLFQRVTWCILHQIVHQAIWNRWMNRPRLDLVESWQPRKSLLLACWVAMKMWVTCDRCLTMRYDRDMTEIWWTWMLKACELLEFLWTCREQWSQDDNTKTYWNLSIQVQCCCECMRMIANRQIAFECLWFASLIGQFATKATQTS